jgi:hypothetical protein
MQRWPLIRVLPSDLPHMVQRMADNFADYAAGAGVARRS